MRNYKLLIFALFLSSTLSAQQIYSEIANSTTNFEFLNSDGVAYNSFHAESNNSISIGYIHKLQNQKGLSAYAGLSYAGFSAIGSDTTYNNYISYSLSYAQLNFGLEQQVDELLDGDVKFYVKGHVSTGIMVNGSQTLNSNVYDVKDHDDFGTILLSGLVGGKVSLAISDRSSIYTQFMYGINDPIPVDRTADIERVRMTSAILSLGVVVNLIKKSS